MGVHILLAKNSGMDVWWYRGPYHHHVSSERVGQVGNGGVAVSIRRLALGAVSWLVAPVNKNKRLTQKENGEGMC